MVIGDQMITIHNQTKHTYVSAWYIDSFTNVSKITLQRIGGVDQVNQKYPKLVSYFLKKCILFFGLAL